VTTRRTHLPAPLVVAASLVAVEGVVLVLLAALELGSLSASRLTMGLTTAAFFLVYGAALLLFAWAVHRVRSWARSPIVLAQLIQLGLAWNLRGSPTTLIAVALALVAVIVVVGLLHPDSMEALTGDDG
jgi:hypothetical protein